MKKTLKKILGSVLVICMVVTFMPVNVFADDTTGSEAVAVTENNGSETGTTPAISTGDNTVAETGTGVVSTENTVDTGNKENTGDNVEKPVTEGDKTETPNDTEVKPAEKTVAKIGEKVYKTLAEAVEAAEDGETIVLTDNIGDEASETNKILKTMNIDKNITIQGEGHIIKRTKDFTGTIFNIEAGKSLNLENLTLDGAALGLSMNLETPNKVLATYDSDSVVGETAAIINKGDLKFNKIIVRNFISKVHGNIIENIKGNLEINGSEVFNNYSFVNGGVIYSEFGTLKILNSHFNNNGAARGGIAHLLKSSIIVEASKIENGFAVGNSGAFDLNKPTNVDIRKTIFSNLTVGNDGGAFCIDYKIKDGDMAPTNLAFQNCNFIGIKGINKNSSIGAVLHVVEDLTSDMNFENCIFYDCESLEGVISNNSVETDKFYIIIKDSKFIGNKGACLSKGHFKVYGSKFVNNIESDRGSVATMGAIQYKKDRKTIDKVYPGHLEIYDTLIENNETSKFGAIEITAGGAKIGKGTIIRHNKGNKGAGVHLDVQSTYLIIEEGAAIYDNEATISGDDIYINDTKNFDGGYKSIDIPVIKNIKFMDDGIERIIGGYFLDNTNKRFSPKMYKALTRERLADFKNLALNLKAADVADLISVYIPYEPEVTTVPNLDIPMEEKPISHEEIEEPELPEVPLSNKPVAPKVKANSIVPKTGVPKTGDGMEEVMWTLGIMISLLGLSFVMRRKENN